jgi:hypothetical protein
VSLPNGTAERKAAIKMVENVSGKHRISLGADKGYLSTGFVERMRCLNATPHVAQNGRGSAIDGRTTRHDGDTVCLKIRKRVEEIFGWMKTIGCLGKLHHRGQERIQGIFTLAAAAYNLIRIRNLLAQGCPY